MRVGVTGGYLALASALALLLLAERRTFIPGGRILAQPDADSPPSQAPGHGAKPRGGREWDRGLIVPGHRIGPLKLGDTRERALEIFPPKPHGEDQEYEYANRSTCGTDYEWVDLNPGDYGGNMLIEFKDGVVTQIGSTMPEFHTVEGLTVKSPPQEVRMRFSDLRAYVLFPTASEALGGRSLTYWVGWNRGIAFSFAYDKRRRRRGIYEIVVFRPNGTFCPEGQTAAPPDWQELAPYSLEPPKEMENRWKAHSGGH